MEKNLTLLDLASIDKISLVVSVGQRNSSKKGKWWVDVSNGSFMNINAQQFGYKFTNI